MKQNRLVQLQNEPVAITYLRASHHCLKMEKHIKYLMIFLSFGICLAAIFNRYLPQLMPHVENAVAIQEIVATVINLISGVIVVIGLVLGFYASRMHTEGTVLQDKYESYVFGLSNPSILRPISNTLIEEYARKTKRIQDTQFQYFLYKDIDDPKKATAQFEYISKVVHSDYKLYLSIQPFFLTIWIGFCVVIFLIAISFNDTFITTLINILIPSLSAVTTIGNSWYGCRLQMRQLQNLINITDQINKMSENKKLSYITDERNMRMLADGLFNYRSSAFVIPTFLEKRFNKSVKNENKTLSNVNITKSTKSNKTVKKVNTPTKAANSSKTTTKVQQKPVLAKPITSTKQEASKPSVTAKPVVNKIVSKPTKQITNKPVVNKAANQSQKKSATTSSQTTKKPTINKNTSQKQTSTKATTNSKLTTKSPSTKHK